MGLRKIMWSRRAVTCYRYLLWWLGSEREKQIETDFYREMMNTVEMLSERPEMGTLEALYSTPKRRYYGYVVGKYKVVYRFTQSMLYVMAIRSTIKRE